MPKYFFMKLRDNFFQSGELVLIEKHKDGFLYSNILIKMYLYSLKNNGHLRLNDDVIFSPEQLASLTGHKVSTVKEALKLFYEYGLITDAPDGSIYMLNIEEMVGSTSTEGVRKKKAREKVKKKADNCPQNVHEVSGTCPTEIDKETELETDTEIDSEREIYGKYQNVLLSQAEYDDLKSKYPDYCDSHIERLSEYMKQTSRTYDSHYATLIKWMKEDFKESDYTCKEGESL